MTTPIHPYSGLIGAVATLQPRAMVDDKRRQNRSDKEGEDDLARREEQEDAHRDQDLTSAAEDDKLLEAPAKLPHPQPSSAAEAPGESHLDIIA